MNPNTKRGLIIASVLLILCIAAIAFFPRMSPKPVEPKVTYLMPERTSYSQAKSILPSVAIYEPVEDLAVAASYNTTSTTPSDSEKLQLEIAEIKRETSAIKAETAQHKLDIAEVIHQNKLLRKEIKFRNWIASDIKPKLEELLPHLEFIMADPTFSLDTFEEYFTEGEDRVFYGEKILELNYVIDDVAYRLGGLNAETREKYLAGFDNLSGLVRMKMRGEL